MRIAIVNDMALVVEVLRRMVRSVPGHQVAWTAVNGAEAVEKCAQERPDLILMDLIMPLMDGVQATRVIMKQSPCAVLIVTATVCGHADKVFAALSAGALDAVATPVFGVGGGIDGGEELLRKIALMEKLIVHAGHELPAPAVPAKRGVPPTVPPIVALGASTGGPNALATILRGLPRNLPAAVVIVQHLDLQFVPAFAEWLGDQTDLTVSVIRESMKPVAGAVYVAETNDHLLVRTDFTFHYASEPADYPYRPSVDELFLSISRYWPRSGVACLLTGMGRDGAQGLLALRRAGWRTIAEDEKTCVVYGMPRAAVEIDAAVEVLPLEGISAAILNELRKEKAA